CKLPASRAISRHCVLIGGWEGMLGGETVVDGGHAHAEAIRVLERKRAVCGRRANGPGAAVQVKEQRSSRVAGGVEELGRHTVEIELSESDLWKALLHLLLRHGEDLLEARASELCRNIGAEPGAKTQPETKELERARGARANAGDHSAHCDLLHCRGRQWHRS